MKEKFLIALAAVSCITFGQAIISSHGNTEITYPTPPGSSSSSTSSTNYGVIGITVDGGGGAVTAGVKADLWVPYACQIQAVTILADQTGSVVFDIWKTNYATFPPVVAHTITASLKPTLSSAASYTNGTLTGWITNVNAGDVIRFNVDSASTLTRATLTLKVLKL